MRKCGKKKCFDRFSQLFPYNSLEEAIELLMIRFMVYEHTYLKDLTTFHTLAGAIESGMVQLNNVNYCIPSDPFGGYKASGTRSRTWKVGILMNLPT